MHMPLKNTCAGKEKIMQTETISPAKLIINSLLRLSNIFGTDFPSVFFFGEYEYPKKDDYLD